LNFFGHISRQIRVPRVTTTGNVYQLDTVTVIKYANGISLTIAAQSDRSNLCIDPPGDEVGEGLFGQHPDSHLERGEDIPGSIAHNSELAKLMEALRSDSRGGAGGGLSSSFVNPASGNDAGLFGRPAQSFSDALNECPRRFVVVDRRGVPPRHNSTVSCAPRCNTDVIFRVDDKRFVTK